MTLIQFDQILASFDWYYSMSDDGRVWRDGERMADEIARMSRESEQHKMLYAAYHKYHFTGEPWKTPKFTREELNAARATLGVALK